MHLNTISLIFAAASLVTAHPPPHRGGGRGINPQEWEKFRNIGKNRGGRWTGKPSRPGRPGRPALPEDDGDCSVNYSDVTTTVVLTKDVQVWETTTVVDGTTSTYMTTTTVDVPAENTPPSYGNGPSSPGDAVPTSNGGAPSYGDGPSSPGGPAPTSGDASPSSYTDGPSSPGGPAPTSDDASPSSYPVDSPSSTIKDPKPTTSDVSPPPYPGNDGNSTSGMPTGSASVTTSSSVSLTPPSSVSSSSSSAAPSATCPAVWRQITQEMMGAFAGCNRPARSSIRFAFHDAAGWSVKTEPYGPASGGADGSIMYSDEEVNRAGNQPLPDVANIFRGVYANFQDEVTAADFVQFAGVIGVRSCGGPIYKTVIGREDDETPCPEFMMPAAFGVNASYEALTSLWADKGISERELGALLGAHSVSVAFAQQANGIPPNSPQDSTPAVMDMNYYKETQANVAPNGVFRFDSDINLANETTVVGQAFADFSGDGGFEMWQEEYAAAAYKLSIMGLGPEKEAELIDCTHIVEELT